MHDASINVAEANRNFAAQQDELHPNGHQVGKYVTIHQFPRGVEVFIDEFYETWSEPDPDAVDQKKADRGEGDRERNVERAARRAKTKVRRLSKAMQADCLLTLTYRENVQDKKRVQVDFKAFRQRLAALGKFSYVATLEKQERGAYHIHVACHQFPAWLKNEEGVRVKSYNLIRSMWRRVVGRDNGNVDLTKPRGRNSSHRIACYIAKYVSKNVDGAELNAKSYWASRDIEVPKPERIWFPGSMETWEIVSMIAKRFIAKGYSDIAQYADRLNAFHWFSACLP
ncbi:MAG: hypothetical protein P4L87_08850 [Formivibrio sp.]|nr:hypothetical protein [Formivibrio sp.]